METHNRETLPVKLKLAGQKKRRLSIYIRWAVVAVVVGIAIGGWLSRYLPTSTFGSATEIPLDSKPTGVFRLAVATETQQFFSSPKTHAEVRKSFTPNKYGYTPSQEENHKVGFEAACRLGEEVGLYTSAQAQDCAVARSRPAVGVSGESFGYSSQLAETLAVMSTFGDFFGDLKVAATGELMSYHSLGNETEMADQYMVISIGGVNYKAQAAKEADVDLLVVPTENWQDAQRNIGTNNHMEIVGVDTPKQALLEVCRRSLTKTCKQTVLVEEYQTDGSGQ